MGTQIRRNFTVVALLVGLAMIGASSEVLAEEEGMRASYKVGDGLKIGDGNNLIHLQGRVQGRFTYNALESAPDNDTWAIQRGRIKIEGFTLERKLKFGFQMDLSTKSGAKTADVCADAACTETVKAVTSESTSGQATLLDYYIDWVPTNYIGIKVGQFKVPYLMQQLTSSGKQQFVDRSSSTDFFDLKRDLGITFHGDIIEDRLNYAVFAMNGDGINTINKNQSMMVGTRLELPIVGEYKTSESDTDHSESPNAGVGIAYAFNDLGSAVQVGTIAAGTKTSNGTLDAGVKYKGFSAQGAAMVSRAHDSPGLTNWGYNAQVGYFLIPKIFEVALRGAGTIFSNAVANQYEYAVALNYFIKGHGFKIQTDYAVLMNPRGLNLNDHRVRTQAQLIF